MDIRVVDRDSRRTVALLSGGGHQPEYLSLEVTERLYGPDDLTIEIPWRQARDVFEVDTFIVDGEVFWEFKPTLLVLGDGLVFELTSGSKGRDEDGRVATLGTFLARDPVGTPRRIMPKDTAHDTQTGPAETALLNLVGNYMGPAAHEPELTIPDLVIAATEGRGKESVWRPRFQSLLDYLKIIAQDGGLGWQSRWDPQGGAEGPAVVVSGRVGETRQVTVSVEDGTLTSEEVEISNVDRRNVVYVAGQGEGTNRVIVKRFLGATEPTGYRRRETFQDARDTDSTATLEARGDSTLRETVEALKVRATMAERRDFRYGVHWNLGDLLPYRNELGKMGHLRVVEVTSRFTESLVPTREAVLGVPFPDPDEDDVQRGGSEFV